MAKEPLDIVCIAVRPFYSKLLLNSSKEGAKIGDENEIVQLFVATFVFVFDVILVFLTLILLIRLQVQE